LVFRDAVGDVDADAFVLDVGEVDAGFFEFVFAVEAEVALFEVNAGLVGGLAKLFTGF